MKRFLTEYRNRLDGGARYAGPILEADGRMAAEALTCCVFGPNGEPLIVVGEIVQTVTTANSTTAYVRRS